MTNGRITSKSLYQFVWRLPIFFMRVFYIFAMILETFFLKHVVRQFVVTFSETILETFCETFFETFCEAILEIFCWHINFCETICRALLKTFEQLLITHGGSTGTSSMSDGGSEIVQAWPAPHEWTEVSTNLRLILLIKPLILSFILVVSDFFSSSPLPHRQIVMASVA